MVLSLAFAAAMLVPEPGPLPPLRLAAFDAYQVWMPRTRQSGPAIIIAIDDESLKRIGQWPWPRDVVARLIDRIADRQPAVIAVDLLFPEPDRASPERLAQSLRERDPVVSERLALLRPNDQILAEALQRSPVVLGVAGIGPLRQFRAGGGASGIGGGPSLYRYDSALHSLPILDSAARGHAVLNVQPERGIVRRVPIVTYVAGKPMLTLALESFRVAAAVPSFAISYEGDITQVQIGDIRVAAQDGGRTWLNFSRHEAARFVSAADVLEGRDDPVRIEGKIAMLGVTAVGLHDQHTTARGETLSGIEIHAQLAENVFDNALLTRKQWTIAMEVAAFLLVAGLIVMVTPRMRPRRSFPILVGCSLTLALAGVACYAWARMLLDPLTPIAGATVIYGFMLSATLVGLDLQRSELGARLALERDAAARVTGELEAARRIQTGMLPTRESLPAGEERFEIFAHMSAAREVGGDLYDFFALPGDRFLFLEGDVSGKGLPAAMFMAVTKALAKSAALRRNAGPADLMTNVNEELSRENPEQMFVTMAALVIDLSSGELTYCNAGHEPPLLVDRNGLTVPLDEGGGPPLCVVDDLVYEEARVNLQRGDMLVLASDGLSEAMSGSGTLYGRDRLRALLESAESRHTDPTALGDEILLAVRDFEGGEEPADDQTLLVLSWRGSSP